MTALRKLTVSLVGVMCLAGLSLVASNHSSAASSAPYPGLTSCPPVAPGSHNSAPAVGSRKTAALTFDDGPGRSTRAIIKILEAFHVRATFFNIGWNINAEPSAIRLEAKDGFLMGDHTNSHPDMIKLSKRAQTGEIVQEAGLQRSLTATVPCVFRPPYGSFNATTMSIANQHGMSLWMWSTSGADWQADGSGSSSWIHRIESSTIETSVHSRHPVVLLHNQRIAMPATVAALPDIIRTFRRDGYVFVDLLGRSGPPGVCGDPRAQAPLTSVTTVASGTTLASGDVRLSPNGQYALTMSPDGQLTYGEVGGSDVWSTPASNSPGAVAEIGDGMLKVVGVHGDIVWSTPTATGSAVLTLGSNGVLSLINGVKPVWTSGPLLTNLSPGDSLRAGWYVSSPNGRCRLTMETSGSLRLSAPGNERLWWTRAEQGGASAMLNLTGSLEIVKSSGSTVWSSETSAHSKDRLRLTNRGTIELVTTHGAVIWATQ